MWPGADQSQWYWWAGQTWGLVVFSRFSISKFLCSTSHQTSALLWRVSPGLCAWASRVGREPTICWGVEARFLPQYVDYSFTSTHTAWTSESFQLFLLCFRLKHPESLVSFLISESTINWVIAGHWDGLIVDHIGAMDHIQYGLVTVHMPVNARCIVCTREWEVCWLYIAVHTFALTARIWHFLKLCCLVVHNLFSTWTPISILPMKSISGSCVHANNLFVSWHGFTNFDLPTHD